MPAIYLKCHMRRRHAQEQKRPRGNFRAAPVQNL
jgi:hypothetical protein